MSRSILTYFALKTGLVEGVIDVGALIKRRWQQRPWLLDKMSCLNCNTQIVFDRDIFPMRIPWSFFPLCRHCQNISRERIINNLKIKSMNAELFNKIQINETLNTKTGSLMVNIREDTVESAIKLYDDVRCKLKVNNIGEIEVIDVPFLENEDFPVIEDNPVLKATKPAVSRDCKLCGAAMKLREGRNGKFWGCTRYNGKNGCRYTEPA